MTQTGRPAFFRSGGQQPVVSQTIRYHRSWRPARPLRHRVGSAPDRLRQRPDLAGNQPARDLGQHGSVDHDRRHVDARLRRADRPYLRHAGIGPDVRSRRSDSDPRHCHGPEGADSSATCRSSESGFSTHPAHPARGRAGDPGHPAPRGADELRPGSEAIAGRETRNPDDYELFLENILEAPRGQRKVWNGRCYNAAWKCDPTAAIFPCVGGVCTGGANGPMVAGAHTPGPCHSGCQRRPATVPAMLRRAPVGCVAKPIRCRQ